MRDRLIGALEFAGYILVTTAAFVTSIPLGLATAGVCCWWVASNSAE